MRISHGNSGKAVLFSVDRDRFSDFRRRNRTSHIHRYKFHLSILYFHGQVLDPGRSLHVDLRFIYDPVIIGIFSYTADPVSAHGTTGSVQIIHIHLAVGNLRRPDQDQSIRSDPKMAVTDQLCRFAGIRYRLFKTVYINIIISDALHLREFHIFSPICSIP